MSMKTIEHAKVQAVGEHEIVFYALAFSQAPDKQGDRIDPHALDEWVSKFYAAGRPLPISYHHAAMRGESAGDPDSVIGYAPATPKHVWVDEKGLGVRAILYDHDKAQKVYRLASDGVLHGASAVFVSDITAEKRQRDGSTLITSIPDVREAGPTLTPANDDAHVLSVKTEEEQMELFKGGSGPATDDSAWDEGAVMGGEHDAAYYRAVSGIAHNAGEPNQRQHWALPHHKAPGRPANASAIRTARARFNQTQDLSNREAARRHIFETHTLPSDRAASETVTVELPVTDDMRIKAGRVISAANAQRLRDARTLIEELLALVENEEEVPQTKSEGPNDWVRDALAGLEEKDTANAQEG